jgi:hypothetical protein
MAGPVSAKVVPVYTAGRYRAKGFKAVAIQILMPWQVTQVVPTRCSATEVGTKASSCGRVDVSNWQLLTSLLDGSTALLMFPHIQRLPPANGAVGLSNGLLSIGGDYG